MRRRAITLVEILVVIAIAGIISAIAFPVFVRAKEAAKGPRTQQNLHALQVGAALYAADQNGASSGTAEAMGLPPLNGTIMPLPHSDRYLEPWYADMKSPFGAGIHKSYYSFGIPSIQDGMPVRWATCTARIGDACVLFYDPWSAGTDPVTGSWAVHSEYGRKRLFGVTLAGNLVTRNALGMPFSQEWWSPGSFTTRE